MEGKTIMDEIFLVIIAITALFIGSVFGWCVCSDSWRQELVDKGFAEWHIVAGTKEVEFKWKENK